MKMIEGADLRALAKRSRILAAPTPTRLSTNSAPDAEKKAAFASPAVARASSVLPVPGGPTSSTPLGAAAPIARYLVGSSRKSRISFSSARASPAPATESKVIGAFSPFLRRLPLPPKAEKAPMPPESSPDWRMKKEKRQTSSRIGIRNWTTITRADLPDCGSICTRVPPLVNPS